MTSFAVTNLLFELYSHIWWWQWCVATFGCKFMWEKR